MTCHELEALRLGMMNVLGTDDQHAREHAEQELEGHLDGPIEGLANAQSLSALQRHLDAALVDLEEEVAATDESAPDYDYLRGRLVAVRDAERSPASPTTATRCSTTWARFTTRSTTRSPPMADRTASPASHRTVELGDVSPAGSRQLGRRSAVTVTDSGLVVAGLADGSVAAFDDNLERRWCSRGEDRGSVVSIAEFGDGVLVGERGADGEIRFHDTDTGAVRWRYRTADDVGDPQQATRFFLPFVVDAVVGRDHAFVATRRYERGDDGDRNFDSVVYAFDRSGDLAWQYETDASPISLDARDDRVAVAFNRCPGDFRDGLLVLDAESGEERRRWDPPGDGDRRVGDVSLVPDGVVLASHADYRGYGLGDGGVRWSVDLGRPTEVDGETVYSYPNHVHATADGALFVTGNTYPEDGRETDARHPNEHTAVGVDGSGGIRFRSSVGGFAHEIASRGDRVAVPAAQHFRERDADRHGLRMFDLTRGQVDGHDAPGVVTTAALGVDRTVAVEEPVSYHDDDAVRGAYRLQQFSTRQ